MKTVFTYFAISFLLLLNINSKAEESFPAPKVRYSGFDISNGNLEIRWNPVDDSRVSYYEIRYYYPPKNGLGGGWEIVNDDAHIYTTEELVLNFSADRFTNADPNEEPVMIGVFAHPDESDNSIEPTPRDTSLFDYTVFLTATWDSCQAAITFNWTNYHFKQWTQPGNSGYKLLASTDNGINYETIATLDYDQNEYIFENVPPNQDYIFYISSISANTSGDSANSNLIEINTDMTILPEYMYANYATYNDGLQDISFSIDPESGTSIYNILRKNFGAISFDTVKNLKTTEKEIVYNDPTDYYDGPFIYQLEVINNCGVNIRKSENTASTILLKQQGEALTPELYWNSYQNWPDGSATYILSRNIGNQGYEDLISLSDTFYIDNSLADWKENEYDANVCYQIRSTNNSFTSTSNPVCFDLPVNIRFEYDAFIPGSANNNNLFGPTIDFIPDEYSFKILDRNGQVVYESTDPEDTHWNGYINGSLASPGAYWGLLQYRVGSGKKHSLHTAVIVIH